MTKKTSQPSATVNLQAISDLCGFSAMTVSRALRNDPRVKPETARTIRAAARRLGYRPGQNMFARRMAMRRHGQKVVNQVVGVFFPPFFFGDQTAMYFVSLYDGIMRATVQHEFTLVTHHTSYPPANQFDPYREIKKLPSVFMHGEVDGAILLGHRTEQERLVGMLRDEPGFGDRPIVSLIEPAAGCSSVMAEERDSARQVMEHLLAHGHRRVLHFCDLEQHPEVWPPRVEGYRDACLAAGLNPDAVLRFERWPFRSLAQAEKLISGVLQADPELTAIIGLYDPMAVQVANMLTLAGYRIPDDISLVGHDDTGPLLAANGVNLLTTVRVPLRQLGFDAVELAIRQILGQETGGVHRTLPTELILRASTGPARPRHGQALPG